jgi:hypothetical protein
MGIKIDMAFHLGDLWRSSLPWGALLRIGELFLNSCDIIDPVFISKLQSLETHKYLIL